MPKIDFNTANLGRAYPLVDQLAADNWWQLLSDCEITVRPNAKYRDGINHVRLSYMGDMPAALRGRLKLPAEQYKFIAFGSDAEGLKDYSLVFPIPFAATKHSDVLGKAIGLQELKFYLSISLTKGQQHAADQLWGGFVTIGDANIIPSGVYTFIDHLPLEPARIKNVAEYPYFVSQSATHIFNRRRNYVDNPPGCDHIALPPRLDLDDDVLYVRSCGGPITDPIRFSGGVQVSSTIDVVNNTITLYGDVGAGDLPATCDHIFISHEEDALWAQTSLWDRWPDRRLDGAPRCDEVLRRINGVDGPSIQFIPNAGVEINAFPDHNRVVVAFSGNNLSYCPDYGQPVPVEFLPTNAYAENCGNNNLAPPPPFVPGEGADSLVTTTTAYTGAYISVDPIACGTRCSWKAVNNQWTQLSFGCNSPCDCEMPDFPATINNMEVSTQCFEVLTSSDNPVRNPDFADAANPLSAWDLDGDAELLYGHESIPSTDFPMIRLGDGGRLIQNKVRVLRNTTYKVIADFFNEEDSELYFNVYALDGLVLLNKIVRRQDYRINYELGLFTTYHNGVNIEVGKTLYSATGQSSLVARIALVAV